MARNRKTYKQAKYWGKLRVDRIHKLVPEGTDVEALVEYLVENDLVTKTQKQEYPKKDGLVPAIRIRYEQYKSFMK